MPRLRTVSTREPGWARVRHGRGFRYLDVDGSPLGPADVARAKALVIPPAWRDVWISPYPNAHLQAVGTDEAGRRQYLYHPVWRGQRGAPEFDPGIEMGTKLPPVRRGSPPRPPPAGGGPGTPPAAPPPPGAPGGFP